MLDTKRSFICKLAHSAMTEPDEAKRLELLVAIINIAKKSQSWLNANRHKIYWILDDKYPLQRRFD